jgi:hypothetical protein
MALRVNWADRKQYKENLVIRINRRKNTIKAEGYDGIYFLDAPEGTNHYYCRHSENDWDKIISVKANKGLTVNFWGTIVTEEPINFNGKDEISARVVEREEE